MWWWEDFLTYDYYILMFGNQLDEANFLAEKLSLEVKISWSEWYGAPHSWVYLDLEVVGDLWVPTKIDNK